ncbi:hypothetical protein EMIHUDRAFT_456989 [Emiliania huxleyi CCMP1516]|uniref:Sugar phosphate transporter domain-containing protein n=2 Tax=Emiliania huxleyi TaxID=2903 RepID=A0A0D3JXH0_EMIH1|nr:hypothetical protein EMIHUDRAFT_456989 [Emiliania huxleyi CCMP1516]EOD28205.1 hypothetical protein EMIHUDRAFT_456989 [Emiliania huxleyi CCMP1516]|eukprot:XP_005780634.1 hypothetical protein EMIHUDRAFT_456989 [Emiliania huxleyi CCMP1516]
MEVAKMALSAFQIVTSDAPSDVPSGSALSKYAYLITHSLTMLVPAVVYLAMNILGFVSLKYIDAATFAILAQMKVFTTAIFSVVLLQRKLHLRKWRALLTLTLGVVLISHEAMPKSAAAGDSRAKLAFAEIVRSVAHGMAGRCLLLKSKTETYSIWDRNFQLAFWQPFAGWTPMAAVCAAVGGTGGVLVALSIKYADSIMKTIATTGARDAAGLPSGAARGSAIVFTTILNAAFLDGPFTLPIVAGAVVVMVSVCNYNDRGDPES